LRAKCTFTIKKELDLDLDLVLLYVGNCSKFSLDLHNFLQKVCYEVLFFLLKFKLASEQVTSVTVYHAVEFLCEIAEL